MKSLLKLIAAAATIAIGTVSFAQDSSSLKAGGVFVEPMVTYQTGDNTVKTSAVFPGVTSDTSGKIDGFGVGGRLGAHVSEIIFLGVDARFSRLNMKDSSYGNATGNAYNYGVTAGAQMPWYGVRAWGSYVFGGQYDPDKGGQIDAKAENAKGYRVGAGIKLASVSLNLEYEDLTYDKTRITSFGSFGSNYSSDIDFKTRAYILSVSFPLAL